MEKQTIVVKVGTSSLTLSDGTMDAEKIRNITTQLAALQTAGHHVILVSSGAIAAGFSRLGFKKRPTKIADKQAAAAVGQGLLMEEYTKNLMAYQIPCAQILLNRSDFEDRRRYKNIFGSLSVLLGRGAIPIINENDTIATNEIKVGDKLLITGPTTGAMYVTLDEARVDLKPVDVVKKGVHVSFKVPDRIRPSDKLYRIVPADELKKK